MAFAEGEGDVRVQKKPKVGLFCESNQNCLNKKLLA